MSFTEWKQRLIADIENTAARFTERDVVDQGDPINQETADALQGLAQRLRDLPDSDERLVGLYKEEQELANVEERQYDEALNRVHDAREEVLRSVGFEHGDFASLDSFFSELRMRADEAIAEFSLGGEGGSVHKTP